MDTLPRGSSLKINQGYKRYDESSIKNRYTNRFRYEQLIFFDETNEKNSKITPILLLWPRYDTLSQIITRSTRILFS